jgi:hypothetical protein
VIGRLAEGGRPIVAAGTATRDPGMIHFGSGRVCARGGRTGRL